MITSRRHLLRSGLLVGGALVVAGPGGTALAGPRAAAAPDLPPLERYATSRRSRLLPGLQLAWADLHNHTLLSDGDGDAEVAFATMREAGVDAAALTDHSTVSKVFGTTECGADGCDLEGIDERRWETTQRLADAADDPGTFTAVRGFEWSSPTLGHVNVWFSRTWSDPLAEAGLVDMQFFYDWLRSSPETFPFGGGADGIFGFNHPGREPLRFAGFQPAADLVPRCVGLELFNREEDYLFKGVDHGAASPLVECLDAGWKPGLLGVTDHHGTRWGRLEGSGRAGVWLPQLSREDLRAGLERRLFFATREAGLRFAAVARSRGGPQVPMGADLPHRSGPVRFVVDVDRLPAPGVDAPSLRGRELALQVLQAGRPLPRVVETVTARLPRSSDPDARTTAAFRVHLDAADGGWVVLRLVDPLAPPDPRADGDLAAGRSLAYSSPFYLRP